jgi:small subunit ribosomal protein S16
LAVKIRLRRMGKKKQPFYRIVAIDSKSARDGRYLDKIGHYNPLLNPAQVVIDRGKAFKWLETGAIPSDSVKSLLRRDGILLELDLKKRGVAQDQIAAELAKFQAAQVQKVKRLEAKAAQAKSKSKATDSEEKPAEQTAAPAEASA